MRILASNPDTIGDMVLRQPLYRALVGCGHELTLIVRRTVEPIARRIVPEAKILVLPAEVYAPIDENWADFAGIVEQARATAPDLLLIAPFQWTRFEERLAAELRRDPALQDGKLRVVGMAGHLYSGDPFAGLSATSDLTFDQALSVDEDVPEADKNALLADMLGCPVASVEPVMTLDDATLAQARDLLAARGLSPDDYWIACVTGTANVPIKAWPAEQWAEVLRTWHQTYGRRFLFVGLPAERSVVDLVLAGMGERAAADSAVWMEPDSDIATLAALAELSAGYVGHDTGPMHIAAAVGKPVLAVFGGGHKLRFAPRATPSVVLSVRVPCAGCGWACSFETSHCVQSLRPVDVLRAVEDLELGRILGRDIRLLPLPQAVQDRMTAFAADLARQRLRMLSSVQRQLDSFDPNQIIRLTQERNAKAQTAEDLSHQLSVVSGEVKRLQEATQSLQTEAGELSRQLQDREAAVVELRQAVEAAHQRTTAEAAARTAEVEPLRKEVEQLRVKLAAMPQPVHARPRRTWRELIVDVVCGKRHYEPRRVPRPMPKLCLVTVVRPGDRPADVLRTIRSVLAEQYPHLEYVVVTDVRTPVSERTREDPDSVRIETSPENPGLRVPSDTGVTTSNTIAPAKNAGAVLQDDKAFALATRSDLGRNSNDPSLPQLLTDLASGAGGIIRIVPPGAQPFAAVAEVLAKTNAEVVGWLDVGLAYEPGALHRAGEFFRDHSLAMSAVQEETAPLGGESWRAGQGWPGVDVGSLRPATTVERLPHVLMRREPYMLLGQINPARGEAAGWDMLIRFSRRFGIRRVSGHGVYRFGAPAVGPQAESELRDAAAAFESTYGTAGRVRGRVLATLAGSIGLVGRFGRDADWRRLSAWTRATTASPAAGDAIAADDAEITKAGDPILTAISPLSRRRPDRLLLSSRDVASRRSDVYRLYLDHTGDAAIAFPPITCERLREHATDRRALAGSAVIAEADARSPYRRYRGGPTWARLVAALPSPYWRIAGAKAGSASAVDRFVSLLGPAVADDANLRALVIGCHDGGDLDAFKARTRWTLTGTESDAAAAAAAEARGYRVFRCEPQDAFMTIPDGEVFDLIVLPAALEHWDDPAWMLRRLNRLLSPGGRIVLRTPNLDSMLRRRFGPTWWHWQAPYHRVLLGRRGLRQLAASVDLRVERLKTVTDAYAAAASVQLNELGLAAVVPDGATFDTRIARRGAKWAGWARTLWDRWGRGDEMWVVLRAR